MKLAGEHVRKVIAHCDYDGNAQLKWLKDNIDE